MQCNAAHSNLGRTKYCTCHEADEVVIGHDQSAVCRALAFFERTRAVLQVQNVRFGTASTCTHGNATGQHRPNTNLRRAQDTHPLC